MVSVILIPARFGSTRFPGKPLALLNGLPLIEHVYRSCRGSRLAKEIVVATDNEEIFRTVSAFGGKAVMTAGDHASGTDRIAEVARGMSCDIIVNVQGDEPLIRPQMIDDVISALDDPGASMGTLARRIGRREEIVDPNVVKVVFNEKGYALYFSRAPIPFNRERFGVEVRETGGVAGRTEEREISWKLPDGPVAGLDMFKHIGIYSYRRDDLLRLSGLAPSRLEVIEKLEQLRALEHGMRIRVRETTFETIGVDTPEDLERVRQCLNSSS